MIRSFSLFFLLSLCAPLIGAQSKSPSDPLNRGNPRSAVTGFLEARHDSNYDRAAQYLDLHQIPEQERAQRGPERARQLEAVLNSDSHFTVLRLNQSPEGNLADDPNPSIEHVASVRRYGSYFDIELERVELKPGMPIWLFTPATVNAIPSLTTTSTASAIESRLPAFLVSIRILETPIWKWIVLFAVVLLILLLFRLVEHLLALIIKRFLNRPGVKSRWFWLLSVLQPWLVVLSAMIFVTVEQFIDPSALGRLYTGRVILLVVVGAFAWCLANLVDLFLSRVDSLLDPRQRIVSHSLIYLGRRTAKVAIFIVAAIIVLDNWGYNMTTMIAGLGVGGIAIALAAQGTIANVFGGVSVIADHPVMVGDFGNFGGVMGTVEDIGMRSTRIRTLNRTLMSIPNAAFAGMNLENYASRDKILFNPTLQIKRGTAKEKIRHLITALAEMLDKDKRVEIGPSPIRLSTLTAPSFGLEIFAYTLTRDIDEFYKIEADLFLEIDELLASSGVELV